MISVKKKKEVHFHIYTMCVFTWPSGKRKKSGGEGRKSLNQPSLPSSMTLHICDSVISRSPWHAFLYSSLYKLHVDTFRSNTQQN